MKKDKITFWVRLTGWIGLISASGAWTLYRLTNNWMFLVNVGIIILFSAYALATSKEPIWRDPSKVMWILLFSVFFSSLLQSFFVLIVYFKVKRRAK